MWTSYRFNKRVLGIAVGERSLLIAEVDAARSSPVVSVAAEFVYPAGMGLEQPEALGGALSEFLREKGVTARRVTLGVPARWVLLRTHQLPPADAQNARAILTLQAQAAASPECGEMIFDFLGESSESQSTSITIMGLPAVWKQRLQKFADAAGLKVISITPTASAFSDTASAGTKVVLGVGAEGAELAVFDGSRMTMLRHLGKSGAIAALLPELRRTIAMLPAGVDELVGSGGLGKSAEPKMTVWRDAGIRPEELAAIGEAVEIPVAVGDVRRLGAEISPATRGCASAIALAVGGLVEKNECIDYFNPKLAAANRPSVRKRTVWAVATAAVVALIGLLVYIDLSLIEHDVAQSDQRLHDMEPKLVIARPFVANMQIVEGFQHGKPKSLACLRDITAMLPEDGLTYLTAFHLLGNMKGDFSGRSSSDKEVINLVDRLRAMGQFADVKQKLDAGGRGAEMTFSVTFTYVPR